MGAALADLFASGRIIDAILVLVVAEAGLIALRPGLFGPRAPLLAGLAAGAGLMLAVRAALAGAPWFWIAAALGAALAAHLGELALRRAEALRRREPTATSVQVPALAADIVDLVGLAADPRRLPPPFAGEGGPCVSRGRERGTTVKDGAAAFMQAVRCPEAGFPSPDPPRGPPAPDPDRACPTWAEEDRSRAGPRSVGGERAVSAL